MDLREFLCAFSLAIPGGESGGEFLVVIRFFVSKNVFECGADRVHVSGLAKDHGNDEPVIRRADVAIGPVKSVEGAIFPLIDIRRGPGVDRFAFPAESVGVVDDILRRNEAAAGNRLSGDSHGDSKEGSFVALCEISQCDLLLVRNRFDGLDGFSGNFEFLSGFEGTEGNGEVVGWIDQENGIHD